MEKTTILQKTGNPIRFLALGDSYTIGGSVAQSQSWPVQLQGTLLRNGTLIEKSVVIAQNGWTTRDLLMALEVARLKGAFDLVTLLIGVNNQYQGLDIWAYETEFYTLLRRAIHFTGGEPSRILVLSIPDWGVTPFNHERDQIEVATEIDQFNAVNLKASQAAGCKYVDVTAISRQAAGNSELLASDGLHPSGKMYAAWVEIILPTVLQILQSE